MITAKIDTVLHYSSSQMANTASIWKHVNTHFQFWKLCKSWHNSLEIYPREGRGDFFIGVIHGMKEIFQGESPSPGKNYWGGERFQSTIESPAPPPPPLPPKKPIDVGKDFQQGRGMG